MLIKLNLNQTTIVRHGNLIVNLIPVLMNVPILLKLTYQLTKHNKQQTTIKYTNNHKLNHKA